VIRGREAPRPLTNRAITFGVVVLVGGVVLVVLLTRVEHDAGERRITELYTKAADQLGSDRAPVRIAGLYALARLGETAESQRQTIVNVVCAYSSVARNRETSEKSALCRSASVRFASSRSMATAQSRP
jgi:hypothetical protein